MNLSIIVAASSNNVIGKDNQLIWHLPEDLRFFKNTTWGFPVIMGRKTFESFNGKPLRGRFNVVLTHQKDYKPEGAEVVHSWDEALKIVAETGYKQAFIIGGGKIFSEAMNKVNRIYCTRVHAELDGDVFFPEIDEKKFDRIWKKDCFADEKHAFDYTFETWEKK